MACHRIDTPVLAVMQGMRTDWRQDEDVAGPVPGFVVAGADRRLAAQHRGRGGGGGGKRMGMQAGGRTRGRVTIASPDQS